MRRRVWPCVAPLWATSSRLLPVAGRAPLWEVIEFLGCREGLLLAHSLEFWSKPTASTLFGSPAFARSSPAPRRSRLRCRMNRLPSPGIFFRQLAGNRRQVALTLFYQVRLSRS